MERWVDAVPFGTRTAAQIPYIVAIEVPPDFCKTQSPVFGFHATETHTDVVEHRLTQAENVDPVITG